MWSAPIARTDSAPKPSATRAASPLLMTARRLACSVAIAGTARRALRLRRGRDRVAAGPDDVPQRAELVQALAVGVASVVVADVVIQRMAGIGHLRSVCDRGDHRRRRSTAALGLDSRPK